METVGAMAAVDFEAMRQAMVASQLRTVGVDDPRLIAALAIVPREAFVPAERRALAYADLSIDLGGGRALNPPMATALLLDAAEIRSGDRVLIVGAATGYAAAVAALLAGSVTALEADPALAAEARANVPAVQVCEGPLEAGAPGGPFDAIVIDGAVEQLPDAIVAQLAEGGRLAAAIDDRGVTRLAVGRRGGSGFAPIPFADASAVRLPGFARPRAFVF